MQRIVRTASSAGGGGGGGTAPSWASALSLNAWTTLSTTNTQSSVQAADGGQYGSSDPGSLFTAWSGAALLRSYGTYGTVVHWGGGHTDGYGNEAYGFDLATLTWTRLTEPSTSGNATGWAGPYTNGILADGTPNVTHTYYFICGRGATMAIARRQVTNTPSIVNMVSSFDPATDTWTNSTQTMSISPDDYDGMCYDSSRDVFWIVTADLTGWASFDPDTDTMSTHKANDGSIAPRCGPVYVPGKDAVLIFGNTTTVAGIDPASPTSSHTVLTTSGTGPTHETGSMVCWSANLGAIVFYPTASNQIYLLTPPAGDWKTGTWVWTQRSLTGTSGTHVGTAGTFGKFQVVEWGSITVAIVNGDRTASHRAVRLA